MARKQPTDIPFHQQQAQQIRNFEQFLKQRNLKLNDRNEIINPSYICNFCGLEMTATERFFHENKCFKCLNKEKTK